MMIEGMTGEKEVEADGEAVAEGDKWEEMIAEETAMIEEVDVVDVVAVAVAEAEDSTLMKGYLMMTMKRKLSVPQSKKESVRT